MALKNDQPAIVLIKHQRAMLPNMSKHERRPRSIVIKQERQFRLDSTHKSKTLQWSATYWTNDNYAGSPPHYHDLKLWTQNRHDRHRTQISVSSLKIWQNQDITMKQQLLIRWPQREAVFVPILVRRRSQYTNHYRSILRSVACDAS